MQPYSSSIDTVGGSALRNASVAVKLNGVLATIFNLDGSPQANPMTTDSTGSFAFRAANGEYTLEITRVGIVPRTETVQLYDPADDVGAAAGLGNELAATGGAALVGHGPDTVADVLDALQLSDYTALRAYAGARKSVYITGYRAAAAPSGIAGMFVRRDDLDPATATDNGGTRIVGKYVWDRVSEGLFSPSLSSVMADTMNGGTLTINCYGDSMTYGQDTESTTGDLQAGINGSSNTRALYQYPEAMASALTRAGLTVTVNNYGFPGDTIVQGKTRFPAAVACDIAIIMFGHNDAVETAAGVPTTSPSDYEDALNFIIRREQAKGAFVVLLTPPRLKESNYNDGSTLQRQRWMRIYESIIVRLGQQFALPVVSVDELVGHRGAEIYCDTVHFNKYGYNEWGWGLAALFAQRSCAPKRIAHGTVMHSSGTSLTGTQTVVDGATVLYVGDTYRVCVSGYFEEAVVAQIYIKYNTAIGGTQRAKVVLGGGTRNDTIQQARAITLDSAPGKILTSDVIHRGYRTLFIEPCSVGDGYVEKVEFTRPAGVLTDTGYEFCRNSALVGVSLAAATETNRFIVDDGLPLRGDFTLEVDLTTAPAALQSAGISLVAEFNEDDGVPSAFISILRLENAGFGFVRVYTGGVATDTEYIDAFATAATVLKVVRTGDNFAVYMDDVLKGTHNAPFKRVMPALYRTDAAVTVNKFTVR